MKFRFSENNSGGGWWLGKKDYEKMFAAGWRYEKPDYKGLIDYDTPFSGEETEDDDAPYGWRHNTVGDFESWEDAVRSFEEATWKDYNTEGCDTCGPPFGIYEARD